MIRRTTLNLSEPSNFHCFSSQHFQCAGSSAWWLWRIDSPALCRSPSLFAIIFWWAHYVHRSICFSIFRSYIHSVVGFSIHTYRVGTSCIDHHTLVRQLSRRPRPTPIMPKRTISSIAVIVLVMRWIPPHLALIQYHCCARSPVLQCQIPTMYRNRPHSTTWSTRHNGRPAWKTSIWIALAQ